MEDLDSGRQEEEGVRLVDYYPDREIACIVLLVSVGRVANG